MIFVKTLINFKFQIKNLSQNLKEHVILKISDGIIINQSTKIRY